MRPQRSYIDGNDFFDDPNAEYKCKRSASLSVEVKSYGECVYPCYVYDKEGKLLRIEYPKLRGKKRWTSRY